MNKALALLAAAAALGIGTGASAQNWGGYNSHDGNGWSRAGYGYGYDSGFRRGFDWNRGFYSDICNGQRAHRLEDKLNHEWREGEMDPGTARRIHSEIDRLEDRSREECREGDGRAVGKIADRFDRIESWIEREAHGDYRNRW